MKIAGVRVLHTEPRAGTMVSPQPARRGTMNADALIARMDTFGSALPAIVGTLSRDDARWKPPDGQWSVLEIVCHLSDEERDDFRSRVRLTLADPQAPWPPIDPEGWARERRYNERDPHESVQRFVNERAASISWLRALKNPDWSRTHVHPRFGQFTAGALLASWASHDALHLRQIAKRLYEMSRRDAGAERIDYAGEWKA